MKRINGNISTAISVITRQNSGDYIDSKRVAVSVLEDSKLKGAEGRNSNASTMMGSEMKGYGSLDGKTTIADSNRVTMQDMN